jgi:hypothetical protein
MMNCSVVFTDVMLQASKLAFSVRQIAKLHPDKTWNAHPGDICGRTWGLMELADHLSAIHTVLLIIAETPNGFINQDALDGLRRELEPAVELLETEWAKRSIEESDRRFFDEDMPANSTKKVLYR